MMKAYKRAVTVAVLLLAVCLLAGCKKKTPIDKNDKYRTFYEIFVYSFYDSDNDGIGDLKGVCEKLDYLNDGDVNTDTDLGITGIWLMPVMPSTTYHKYDVTDYCAIDEEYGTMEDFDELISECDKRGINVIIDFVMNHTSSKHPWFVKACEYLEGLPEGEEPDLKECPYVSYYNFNKGMKWGWYQVGDSDWYYEAGFWSEMPDLNLYSEDVRRGFEEIAKFWLDRGVSGFRLDAVKEYVSDDTDANIEILKWFNDYVKSVNSDAYLVGEAWTSQPEYARYYQSGIDSMFDFAFAGKDGYLCKFANSTYKARDLGEYLTRENERFKEQSESYINAPFYSNHDMDRCIEYYEGDYGQEQAKMAAALNLTMSGNAFVYYGDETGMCGSGRDENKRLAMNWSEDANGRCRGPADADEGISQKYPSVEVQLQDSASMLNWYKSIISLRNSFESIRKGDSEELTKLSDDRAVSILKTYKDEKTLIIYNFSHEQDTLDMAKEPDLEKSALSKKNMALCVSTNGDTCSFAEGKITVPAFSITVFKIK